MLKMDEFAAFSNNVHADAVFIVDYVGREQATFAGNTIPGPYAVFIKAPKGEPEYLHSSRTVYYAVRQAKADQRNWELKNLPIIISEPCKLILDIEIGYFTYLQSKGIDKIDE